MKLVSIRLALVVLVVLAAPLCTAAVPPTTAPLPSVAAAPKLAVAPTIAPAPTRSLEPRAGRQVSVNDGIQGYLIAIGYFINFSLIPLLLAVALLVFLYNMVRYFMNSANQEAQEKGKRGALYGVAAFVMIVSIWGVVNLLVGGFRFDREAALCPDYLGTWCGSSGFVSFNRTPVTNPDSVRGGAGGVEVADDNGTGSGTGTGGNSGTGSGTGAGGNSGTGSDRNDRSPLAELLFGDFADGAAFTFRNGPPRAQTNTVAITATASCQAGFDALTLAAEIETTQAAYALYRNETNTITWQNITDVSSALDVGYDADVVNDLVAAGARNLHIVHTHPQSRTTDAGLQMAGHGPSAADLTETCDTTAPTATYITVDWQDVWAVTQPAAICPRRTDEEDVLVIADALYAIALVDAADREFEWDRMLRADVTPNRYRDDLAEFGALSLNGLTTNEILELAQPYIDTAQITINRTTAAAICSNL